MTRRRSRGGILLVTLLTLLSIPASQQREYTALASNSGSPDLQLNVSKAGCRPLDSKTGTRCEHEGFFVSSFVQLTTVFQPSLVLGRPRRPQCCRPELPSVEQLGMESAEDTPVAIIPVGCHLAVDEEKPQMTCQYNQNSLVIGFENYQKLRSKIKPRIGALCCMPVLLMSSGVVRQLKLCNCDLSENRHGNCPRGRFLQGFDSIDYDDDLVVPDSAPRCCDICVEDSSTSTVNVCDNDLNNCNGHGVCVHGVCKCLPDWIGEDCGTLKDEYLDPPELESSVWWLGGLGFIGAFFCLFATFWIIRRAEHEGPRAANDRGLLGLINTYINDTGSVGSADTESVRSQVGDESGCREEPKAEGCTTENDAYRPLLQMTCCLCEEQPVQVTLIPCGHSNLCRKCSRKLTTCPFCRKTVVRRQRLFLSV